MTKIVDYFFSPYPSAQERRLRAALEDGLAHCSRIEPHDPAPGEPVTLLFSTNALKPIERVAVYYTTDGTEPSGEYGESMNSTLVLAEAGEVTYDEKMGMLVKSWRVTLPGQPDGTLVRYRADGWNQAHREMHWYTDTADPISMTGRYGRLFAFSVDRLHTPEWFHDAVIYQIFIDRFSAASDEPPMRDPGEITGFFGGTLGGVMEKLDYIQRLGANCIWLSPIFESPTHHGYNISDYYTVARRYGTNETLRQLIAEAHQRGIRVILDFVANHTSDEHPSFIDAETNPESPKAQWYSFGDWPPYGYRSYAKIRNMPELVTEHPDVQRYLIDAALYWLGYFGADGLRLDYVPGPPHGFWTLFQREIKEYFPQALTVGEITSPLPEIANYAGRMDAYMDFTLAKMLRRVFAQRKAPLRELLTFLDERKPLLPQGMDRATLLDNHDMHRFLWLAGGNIAQLKLAAVCHMTLEGTPIIYYGTEVGLSQYEDAKKENAYARAPMIWDERQDSTLLEHYHRLIQLRHTHPALRRGGRVNVGVQGVAPVLPILSTDADALDASTTCETSTYDEVGAYLRICETEFLLIVLNNGEHAVRVHIQLGEQLAAADIKAMRDVLAPMNAQEVTPADGLVELELPALSAVILEPIY